MLNPFKNFTLKTKMCLDVSAAIIKWSYEHNNYIMATANENVQILEGNFLKIRLFMGLTHMWPNQIKIFFC